MDKLYPLKFKPIFKDKIWGGHKIKDLLGMDFGSLPNCGEVWLLSGVAGDQSIVENGFLGGNELNELVEIYMGNLIGEEVFNKFGEIFPVLIKIIDSNDYLSVQVHPDDILGAKRHQSFGKTEMWYINQADKNAELIAGFKKEIDQETYLHHLKNKSLKEILNFEDTQAGDVFFMPAGRVHALGPGNLLTEIQQTSDITYRIYDWDRPDDKGNFRELHTEQALDAIDFKVPHQYKTSYTPKKNKVVNLAQSPYFTTNLLEFDQPLNRDFHTIDSFVIYIGLEGVCSLNTTSGNIEIKKGECVLVPAEIAYFDLVPEKNSKVLEVYIQA